MLSPNGIQAIFFDLDGTLRHNLPAGGDVLMDYASQLGLRLHHEDRLRAMRWEHYYWANSMDLKTDREIYPQENREFWQNYCRRQLVASGASSGQAEELTPKISRYMEDAYRPKSVVPEDVLRLLPQLQQAGYSMAVISNREKPYQQEIESLGIAPYFVFSLAGGEVNAWKPEPDIFYHACKRMDIKPSQAVYVGDNYFADVIGARRAGLQPVLYDPRGIFPDAGCPVLARFDQLPTVLEAL
ncbi:MAG TPA: HAD family hydrolase [Anaerolineales bacterium]|nr:HAD family hydrolase [Anaerolineales bacterium]